MWPLLIAVLTVWACLRTSTTFSTPCLPGRKKSQSIHSIYWFSKMIKFAILFFRNAIVVIGAGFFFDKLGNTGNFIANAFIQWHYPWEHHIKLESHNIKLLFPTVGLLLFSSFGLVGACFVAIGAMFPGTSAMLPLMLCGRLMFGAGQGAVTGNFACFRFINRGLALCI